MAETFPESYLPAGVITSLDDVNPSTDLIVVLGKNKGQEWDMDRILATPDFLSQDSQLNALAAGLLWGHLVKKREEASSDSREDIAFPDIVFSGGMKLPVPGGVTERDEWYQGDAAKRYMERKYPNIPDSHVFAEVTGYSTPKAAEAVRDIVTTRGYGHVALLTVGYHQVYAPESFRQFDVPIESVVASEYILAERSPQFRRFIDENWRRKPRIQREDDYSRTKIVEVTTVDVKGVKSDERTRLRAEGLDEEASQGK